MKVVKGKGLGKKLGFPTINLGKQRFGSGVFFVKVAIDGRDCFGAMHVANDGYTEIHLFDYDDTAYGKDVSVDVIEKIRDTRRFEEIEELKKQIAEDVKVAKNMRLELN